MVFHRARIKTKSSEISIRDNKISRVFSTIILGVIVEDNQYNILKIKCQNQ